ncbi:MAG TPA: EscU/YscU/HrcU family type III secretion system export apparatus switch protein [Rhodocyclaceae bacterium]|nr:EscU/YscU/HrcU family type III secretion system export apparatus switch protein [Rhodocyclaceae bacterium]
MSEQEQQGSEQPTPYKLERAREQGSVPRSTEITGVAVVGIFFVMVALTADNVVHAVLQASSRLIISTGQFGFSPDAALRWLGIAATSVLVAMLPAFFSIMAIVVVATIVQAGPVFAIEAVKPKWEKINPVTGFKRLFSKRSLIETLKASVKLVLFGLAIYFLVSAALPKYLMMTADSGLHLFAYTRSEVSRYALKLFALLVVFALIDLLLVRREFLKKMMMSRKELRDEHKNREGDPRIKSRIRELRQELMRRTQSLRKVPQADVLLTNPTRLAIALRYRRDEDLAPKVIAKGAGEMAARMRSLARKHGIPVVEQPRIAREIFRSSRLDDVIPSAVFPQVAKIMAWAIMIRRNATKGASA